MKKILLLLLILFQIETLLFSQAPGKFNYQAVARNTSGNLIINQNISVRVSILTGSASGSSEFTETHSVTTDAYGVFNILVGGGSVVSGTFSGITWGSASKFLKIEADITGGTTYQTIATTQILSAPYALYANESGTKTFNDNEFNIIYAAGIADNPITAPSAILAGMGAGNVDIGKHDYIVTFVTAAGETGGGPASGSVTVTNNTVNGKILVSGIPLAEKTNVTARNIYRRFNNTGDYKLLVTINDNTTTTYIDNTANINLGKIVSNTNGTTRKLTFNASQLTQDQIIKIPNGSGTLLFEESDTKIMQTYNGAAFNTTASNYNNQTNSYEFPTILPSELSNKNYLLINITYTSGSMCRSSSGYSTVEIQTKNSSGSYTSRFIATVSSASGDYWSATGHSATLIFPHQLTESEKSEGVTVKIIGSSNANWSPCNSSLTNLVTFIYSLR